MADLQTIRNKMRRLTARDESQLSDLECNQYINDYINYSLPADLRALKMEDTYVFSCQPGIETYYFDSENYDYVDNPVKVGGYPAQLLTSSAQFFSIRPRFSYIQQIATGNGTQGPYTGTINSTPFYRSYNTIDSGPFVPGHGKDTTLATFPEMYPIGVQQEVLISAKISNSYALNCTDTPNLIDAGRGMAARYNDAGTFVGDVLNQQSGSINYMTGAVSITFKDIVPAGAPIFASVYVYAAARPRYILFNQNLIQISPCPDQSYIIELKTYRKPASLIQNGSMPELQEMWELIACGAAMKVFEDNADQSGMAGLQPSLEKYESLVRSRGLIQRTRNRVPTIYSFPYATPGEAATPYFAGGN